MKPFARSCLAVGLCLVFAGCGSSEARVWRGPRVRAGYGSGGSIYAPPVEPMPLEPFRQAPNDSVAPPVRPGDLEPVPTPAIRLEEELPPPPSENEESAQFTFPAPPSSMPNALDPVDSRPILEQSSAERPLHRHSSEVLGEGKIARHMRGHSTCPDNRTTRQSVQLLRIEPEHVATAPAMMQVQYLPLLAPVPNL